MRIEVTRPHPTVERYRLLRKRIRDAHRSEAGNKLLKFDGLGLHDIVRNK